MMHKYKVRLTLMLNTCVEVEASTQEEAESQAFDKVARLGRNDNCWIDDGDVQVEDDTCVLVNGQWENAHFVAKELGGEGLTPNSGL